MFPEGVEKTPRSAQRKVRGCFFGGRVSMGMKPMRAVPSLREVIARGGKCLAAEGNEAIVAFVRAHRCADGGFSGKSASSDLYYTVFGAATLDALGHRRLLLRLPRYVASFGGGASLDFIHRACLLQLLGGLAMHKRAGRLLPSIEEYRSRDGGYSHTQPDAVAGSAYAAHLALEAYAAAGRLPPCPQRIRDALDTLRTPDGGYANTAAATHGQTNATAAACVARMRLGLAPETAPRSFLLKQFDPESGGFLAYPSARVPDLLSTASALYALYAMGDPLEALAPRCRAFVESLWNDTGGFHGAWGDPLPDCEYTAYALLALGALL